MKPHTRPSFGTREKITHKVLHYLNDRTSPKWPEWRDVTLRFFYEIYNLMNDNPSLNPIFHRADGLRIYSGRDIVAYLHFYQRHFLIHAESNYLIWDVGDTLFSTRHTGSHARMWKVSDPAEISAFLQYLAGLPRHSPAPDEASRTIPVWVQEQVYDRDGGKCVACGSTTSLCFDHILPYSRGGASDHPNNIQLLCSKCNGEKSAQFWPVTCVR